MFQAVPPPIIRSSKLYTEHRVFVELLLFPTASGCILLVTLEYVTKRISYPRVAVKAEFDCVGDHFLLSRINIRAVKLII